MNQEKNKETSTIVYWVIFMVLMYFIGKAFGCNDGNAVKKEIESGNYYH